MIPLRAALGFLLLPVVIFPAMVIGFIGWRLGGWCFEERKGAR